MRRLDLYWQERRSWRAETSQSNEYGEQAEGALDMAQDCSFRQWVPSESGAGLRRRFPLRTRPLIQKVERPRFNGRFGKHSPLAGQGRKHELAKARFEAAQIRRRLFGRESELLKAHSRPIVLKNSILAEHRIFLAPIRRADNFPLRPYALAMQKRRRSAKPAHKQERDAICDYICIS